MTLPAALAALMISLAMKVVKQQEQELIGKLQLH